MRKVSHTQPLASNSYLRCGALVGTVLLRLWTIRSSVSCSQCCTLTSKFLPGTQCLATCRLLWRTRERESFSTSRYVILSIFICQCALSPLFKDLLGKVHICMDGWTSPNMFSFLGVTAHWHEGGEIRHIILDFIKYVVLFISIVLD